MELRRTVALVLRLIPPLAESYILLLQLVGSSQSVYSLPRLCLPLPLRGETGGVDD